jgi:hypothetical protein
LIEPAILARVGSTPAAAVALVVSTDMSLVPRSSRNDRAGSQGPGDQRLYAVETAAIMVNGALRPPRLKKAASRVEHFGRSTDQFVVIKRLRR